MSKQEDFSNIFEVKKITFVHTILAEGLSDINSRIRLYLDAESPLHDVPCNGAKALE